MKFLARIAICFILFALSHSIANPSAASERLYVSHYENVLGTSLELKIAAPTKAQAEKAEAAALAEIDREAKILSAYDPASEFSRWVKTSQQPTRVSPELFEVLSLFDQWRTRSDGALDASAEVVSRLWKAAATEQRVPSPDELATAVASIHRPHWQLDAVKQTATHLSDAPLALNSFAKSYIVNHAADAALSAAKVSAIVVNIGGDLVVRGALTEPVQIADPQSDAENSDPIARLLIRNRAVATSGNYRRGVQIGGRWYSHIVDPRTARPVDHVISATVVAPNAADAGALATTFCVLTPAESLRLAASLPDVECLLITKDGQAVASPGWATLEAPRLQAAAISDTRSRTSNSPSNSKAKISSGASLAAQTWDASFELVINFEVARIEDFRARRPYVAVWVEDKDKFPVRTIALWYNKPRWLPELKAWGHSDRLRASTENSDLTSSVSSATRSPGQYTLKWDGKDNKGNLVKPGKYTVYIEAAREHGTYQLMRQEMEFTGTPKHVQLEGNVEIASASLDYRKKTTGR